MLPVTITSIKQAFQEVKSFGCEGWEGDYRIATRQALKEILEHRMHNQIDRHLEEMRQQGVADRRNGVYSRHLLTELGDIELLVPRTRTFNATLLLKRYARRLFPVESFAHLTGGEAEDKGQKDQTFHGK